MSATVHSMASMLKDQKSAMQNGSSGGDDMNAESLLNQLLGAFSASSSQTSRVVIEFQNEMKEQLQSEFANLQRNLPSSSVSSTPIADRQNELIVQVEAGTQMDTERAGWSANGRC